MKCAKETSVRKNCTFPISILNEMQIAADNCCNSNVSEYLRRLHNGGHAANTVTTRLLEGAVERAVRKALGDNGK